MVVVVEAVEVLTLMLGHCGLSVGSSMVSTVTVAPSESSTNGVEMVLIPDDLVSGPMVAVGHIGRMVVVCEVVEVVADVVGHIGLVVVADVVVDSLLLVVEIVGASEPLSVGIKV